MKTLHTTLLITGLVVGSMILAGCQGGGTTADNASPVTGEPSVKVDGVNADGKSGHISIEQLPLDGTMESQGPIDVSNAQPADGSTSIGPQTINITADGFSPSTLIISKGTKVTFRNTDTKPHWPASDPHPIHTILPGLDPKKELTTNQSFEYTFDASGSFPYHDHLYPDHKGTIIVTE